MELEWRDLDLDTTSVEDDRRDLAEGRTGPRLSPYPCMMQKAWVDLDIRLDGPFPIGLGRDVIMEVSISSSAFMADRIYLGPPIRHLALTALPLCLPTVALPDTDKDDNAYGYVDVQFIDLANRRYVNFGGEDAFPVFFWRNVRVDWSVMPWLMPGTESLSNIMVTPQP